MQLHDFNPGIESSGLFWTVPIAPSGVRYDPARRAASYRVDNLYLRDFHDAVNGVASGPSDPAAVTFEINWRGTTKPAYTKDPSANARFAYDYVMGEAQISFQAKAPGFTFRSDPITTSSASYAVVGHEWNGAFFSKAPYDLAGAQLSLPPPRSGGRRPYQVVHWRFGWS